tara:strand:+ start:321 stop:662 length:342 start_codon:yes stop_codon:yes gene_type:complete
MKIKKFNVYSADLNPKYGTEPGKIRPVVVVQTDMLNKVLKSTVICPITTNVIPKATLLRVHLKKNQAGLNKNSDIIIDQMRAIDNQRFVDYIGEISQSNKRNLINNLSTLLIE